VQGVTQELEVVACPAQIGVGQVDPELRAILAQIGVEIVGEPAAHAELEAAQVASVSIEESQGFRAGFQDIAASVEHGEAEAAGQRPGRTARGQSGRDDVVVGADLDRRFWIRRGVPGARIAQTINAFLRGCRSPLSGWFSNSQRRHGSFSLTRVPE
jgi:hypothetical protein